MKHLCFLVLCFAFLVSPGRAVKKPNIIFIMVDDLGYFDPGCYNPDSKIPTPHLDRLAREGMRFTDAYASSSVCVPSRYALLTGRYPHRMRGGPGPLIEKDRPTLATLLASAGYHATCVGKWHLGFENEKTPPESMELPGGPVDRGFHDYFGIPASLDIPPYYYIENGQCVERPTSTIKANYSDDYTNIQGAFWLGGGIAPGYKHSEVMPKFTEKALGYLEKHAGKEKPFFLYLAYGAPHTPWVPGEKHQGASQAGLYGDFVHETDANIGQILAFLDQHQLNNNTLVFFTSDNGPIWHPEDQERFQHTSLGPLRGMKGDIWEGGLRMPFLARWPGKIEAGSVSHALVSHVDMLATCAALTGAPMPPHTDSQSFLPVLLGDKTEAREHLVLQSSRKALALRRRDWKYINQLGSGGFIRPPEVPKKPDGPGHQLYNLKEDVGESNNLAASHPEIAAELQSLLAAEKEPK